MFTPLDSIFVKLERAEETIAQLRGEISNFLTMEPLPYAIRQHFADDLCSVSWEATELLPPPKRLSVLAGEVIHHTRSAFDYLVVALVKAQNAKPLNNHQFPVCKDWEKFKRSTNSGNLNGISRSARKKIESLQPYNVGSLNYTLAAIHEMDVVAKHRELLILTSAHSLGDQIIFGDGESYGPQNPTVITTINTPTYVVAKEGNKILEIKFEGPTSRKKIQPNFQVKLVFDKCGSAELVPVIDALTLMVQFTRQTIESFADEF